MRISETKGGFMGQRHRRLVAAPCGIGLLTIVPLVGCQNALDVDDSRNLADALTEPSESPFQAAAEAVDFAALRMTDLSARAPGNASDVAQAGVDLQIAADRLRRGSADIDGLQELLSNAREMAVVGKRTAAYQQQPFSSDPVDAIDAAMDALGVAPPGQRTAERAAVALGDRMREIEEQGRPEYEAALARFAAAADAADRGDGTWAAALATGEAVLALATAMEGEMSAIATEMAAVEATAPPEVAALAAPSRIEFEQAVHGMQSVVAGLSDQLEVMRTLVADLERSSDEQATRYEIPLVKADGAPYFPGEWCDSPWVKHTPITFEEEWRGPSDTGWLCESTTSTAGEPTARWCMTTGWEQGFFMCSSGNVARRLRGWRRSE